MLIYNVFKNIQYIRQQIYTLRKIWWNDYIKGLIRKRISKNNLLFRFLAGLKEREEDDSWGGRRQSIKEDTGQSIKEPRSEGGYEERPCFNRQQFKRVAAIHIQPITTERTETRSVPVTSPARGVCKVLLAYNWYIRVHILFSIFCQNPRST